MDRMDDPSDIRTRIRRGFQLLDWTAVPRAHELRRGSETVHVEPKVMDVLVALAARAGEVVTREELLAEVWPDVFVSESALNRTVSQLRKLFDDDPRAPRLIETVPKAGYRLIAPVRFGIGGDSADALAQTSDGVGGEASLPPVPALAAPPPPPKRGPGSRRWAWSGLAVLALAGVLGVALVGRGAAPEPARRAVPLTSQPGVEMMGAISPDGAHVAYRAVQGRDSAALWVRPIAAETPLRLTAFRGDLHPAWLPGGDRVAFLRCEAGACTVRAVSAVGKDERQLVPGAVLGWAGLDVSPDGRWVAAADTAAPHRLVLTEVATGQRRPLPPPPAGYRGDSRPRFSPDGRHLAFERQLHPGAADLYVIDLGTEALSRLTHDVATIAGFAWEAGGEGLLMSSNRSGMYDLWRVPVRGGALMRATPPLARDPGGPVLRGDRLVYEEWQFEINLYRVPLDGAEPARLVASTWWDKQPSVTDAGRLAFISNRTGAPEVWTAAADGSGQQRQTRFEGASVLSPRWSPGGEQIAFVARPEAQAALYLMRPGETPRALGFEADALGAPRWSRDGAALYVPARREGRQRVWRVPLDGAAPVPVVEAAAAEEAADGSGLVYATAEGLWHRPTGGAARLVGEGLSAAALENWAVVPEGVLYLKNVEGRARLTRVTLDGAETIYGANVSPVTLGEPALAVSPDGRAVVVARTDRVDADLILVEPAE